MNSTKDAHELQKRNSRAEQGGLKEIDPRRSTANSLHYHCTSLINKKSTTVQIRDLDIQVQGSQKTPQEW